MNRRSISALVLTLLFAGIFSCHSTADQTSATQEDREFYPLSAFIRQELAEIDSLPVAVFLYTEAGGITDTTLVEKQAFRTLAEAIALPDITRAPLKNAYRETVFHDATLNLVTMSYSPTDPSTVPVKKIDLYIHPETGKVKSAYIEKLEISGDSTLVEKTVWSAGKQAQITRLFSKPGQPDRIENRKFSWGLQ